MFEKILVPLDGSDTAESALIYAAEISRQFGSAVVLLHVCTRECQNYAHMHRIYLEHAAGVFYRESSESQALKRKLDVTAVIEHGDPLETIKLFAEKNDIGLIIMTTEGTTRHTPTTLGRVAEHISRSVRVPLLLVNSGYSRQQQSPIIKHVLVCLDGSDLSQKALPYAAGIARLLQIPVTIFQMALNNYPFYGDPPPFVDYEKMASDEEKRIRLEMAGLSAGLKPQGLVVDWEVTSGSDAAHAIFEMSKKLGDCLIVMSTHGRSGLGRWALGSVAEKVLRYSNGPLLLVPAAGGRQA